MKNKIVLYKMSTLSCLNIHNEALLYNCKILEAETNEELKTILSKYDFATIAIPIETLIDEKRMIIENRESYGNHPIIYVDNCGNMEMRLRALYCGASTGIQYPFLNEEFLRISYSLINKEQKAIRTSNLIIDNNLKINIKKRELVYKGKVEKLTPNEFDILVYLVENVDIVVTREEIINNGLSKINFNKRLIDRYISNLRKILNNKIVTKRGVGYKYIS